MIEVYVYMSPQTNNQCPMSKRRISENFSELKNAIETHKDSLENEIIPTYMMIDRSLLISTNLDYNTKSISYIFPDGTMHESVDNLKECITDINNEYNAAVYEVTTNELNHFGIGIKKNIATAFTQWYDGCYIANMEDKLSSSITESIKESRKSIPQNITRTDLDVLNTIMQQNDLTIQDIEHIWFKTEDNVLEDKDYNDFFNLLDRVVVIEDKEEARVRPVIELHISAIENYKYEIIFSNGFSIERDGKDIYIDDGM